MPRSTYIEGPKIKTRLVWNWKAIAATLALGWMLTILGFWAFMEATEPPAHASSHCETITTEDGYSYCDG